MKKARKQDTHKKQNRYDKGQVFVKVMAGILALLMLLAASASIIFALIG